MTDVIEDEDGPRPRTLSNLQVFSFVWRGWMTRRARFYLVAGLFLAGVGCEVAIPWLVAGLINAVSSPERLTEAAWRAWAGLSGLYVFYYVARLTAFRFMAGFSAGTMERIVREGFARVQRFSSEWHANSFAGSTVRKVTRAMWGFDAVTDAIILMLMPTVVVLIGLSISIGLRWWAAGLLAGGVAAAFITMQILMSRFYTRPANLISNRLDTTLTAAMADALSSNPVVKSFGAEGREEQRFDDLAQEWRKAVVYTWNRFNNVAVLSNILMVSLQAGVTGLLVWAWSEGRATPGDVAFGVTSFMLMQSYLRNFNENMRMLQRGLDDTLDVAEFMRTPLQLADQDDAPAFRHGPGEIRFEDITFRYENKQRALYQGFNLTIRPGERVALVGATGSGKSTLVKLLQRLYDLNGGRIVIDGQDVAHVEQGSLRRAIAIVPQDPALFHRTIAEDIRYGRPDATDAEVETAAARARAHEFIAALPKGYDTLVGERGVKLSGGERQRVAIARAFLADAPILVLDEATSSLDVETERKVQEAVEALMAGRTTIVIAHRLSTVRAADRILVFEKGRVVEEGRHDELVARGGAYARLNAVAGGLT